MAKRIVGIVCLYALFSMATHAQFLKGFGLKAGTASARQTWDYTMNINLPIESHWGIDAGLFVEVLDAPYISVLGEIHYIQKGFSMTLPVTTPAQPEGTGEFITVKPRVDYLSVPLLAKLRLEVGAVTPYVFGGPRLDFLIGTEPDGFQGVLDRFKGTDVGASFGVGLEVPLGIVPTVLVEFRYSPSFTEAFSNNALKVKNESIELLLGVRL